MKIILTESQYNTLVEQTKSKKKYYVDKSNIHGRGVFASKDLDEGEEIGLLHTINIPNFKYDFTELGKMHNHSDKPSCHNLKKNNSRFLVASRPIKRGEELTTDYTLQKDLEQPEEWWGKITESEKKKKNEMKPHIDGYRHYSPFKNLPYILVPYNGIDCDGIVHDLILVGDNGKIKYCKKDTGSKFLEGAKTVLELPFDEDEDLDEFFKDERKVKSWVKHKLELYN